VDSAVEDDDEVSIHYDPMIAKLIVHGADRDESIAAMCEALDETVLTGLVTNQEFLANIFRQKNFAKGDIDTGFIARHEKDLLPAAYGQANDDDLAIAALLMLDGDDERDGDDIWDVGDNWRLNAPLTRSFRFTNRGQAHDISITARGTEFDVRAGKKAQTITRAILGQATIVADERTVTIFRDGHVVHLHLYVPGAEGSDGAGEGRVIAPMPGKIIDVMVKKGAKVTKDQPLLIMEAMKMQMTIRAAFAGTVDDLPVKAGQQVQDGALLVSLEAA
jgi:3-methylcrotonyl-CoA carboxylase alpha subunit